MDERIGHDGQRQHQPLPQSPAAELTLDEKVADLVYKWPGRRLLERFDEDVKVVPESLADFFDVLEAKAEERNQVDGRDFIAENDSHLVKRGSERPTDANLATAAELEVVVSNRRPTFATDGKRHGGILEVM